MDIASARSRGIFMEALHTIESDTSTQAEMLEAREVVNRTEVEKLAWDLIAIRGQIPNIEVKKQERADNARTALMEALTASGHLSHIEITGELEEVNQQVLNRLLNGWSESLPLHEKSRRFAELCNELTIQEIQRCMLAGMLSENIEILEVSDFPLAMGASLAEKLGYRVENKKGMVRSTGLKLNPDGTITRVIEQTSRSNATYISTFAFFDSVGIENTTVGDADVVALSKPALYSRDEFSDGVVDVQRRIDYFSGGRFGDSRNALHLDYGELRDKSLEREKEIEFYVDKLADFEVKLDKALSDGNISATEKDKLYKQEVRNILEAICTLAPEYARDCFGEKVEHVFYQASNLVANGQINQANNLILENRDLQNTIVFCGVSISADKAKELGLAVDETGKLISEGKESWTYKKGVCRVQACPTRPGQTEVGPCSICRNCQARFDKGQDPTKDKISTSATEEKRPITLKDVLSVIHSEKLVVEPQKLAK